MDGILGGKLLAEFRVQIGKRGEVANTPRVDSLVELPAAKSRLPAVRGKLFELAATQSQKILVVRQRQGHATHFTNLSTAVAGSIKILLHRSLIRRTMENRSQYAEGGRRGAEDASEFTKVRELNGREKASKIDRRLTEEYSRVRISPGNRFAFHSGWRRKFFAASD